MGQIFPHVFNIIRQEISAVKWINSSFSAIFVNLQTVLYFHTFMISQISMDHRRVRSMSMVRHPSYYRFTSASIFLHVLIISIAPALRTVNPDFGRSTGEITRIILHMR